MVTEVNDGAKAIAAAIESWPHVAILDFSMPRMTGVEAARRIRDHLADRDSDLHRDNSGLIARCSRQARAHSE